VETRGLVASRRPFLLPRISSIGQQRWLDKHRRYELGAQAHGHRHCRALLSRGRRHGLAGFGAATGFFVNLLGCRVIRLGLGLGLGIADGLRQHLA
jgi:hypothetical protein